MSKPVVLITGALTGIGRVTAVAFAKEGARLVVSGPSGRQKGTPLRLNFAALTPKPHLSRRTFVMTTRSASWSIRPSPASAGSMPPSTVPARRASRGSS